MDIVCDASLALFVLAMIVGFVAFFLMGDDKNGNQLSQRVMLWWQATKIVASYRRRRQRA